MSCLQPLQSVNGVLNAGQNSRQVQKDSLSFHLEPENTPPRRISFIMSQNTMGNWSTEPVISECLSPIIPVACLVHSFWVQIFTEHNWCAGVEASSDMTLYSGSCHSNARPIA